MDYLLEKIDTCHNNPEKSGTSKIENQLLVIYYYSFHVAKK